jgi:hypothetical protein
MYAERLGAAEHPDAPQGLEGRMTHPATTFAATAPQERCRDRSAQTLPRPDRLGPSCHGLNEIYFLQSVAIFLEMRRAPVSLFRDRLGYQDCSGSRTCRLPSLE